MRRILILAASPRNKSALNLKREEREISDILNRAKQRGNFKLLPSVRGVTTREIQDQVLNQEPHIIHFCGHGEGEPGIYLEDELGNAKLVSETALAGLFKVCEQVECVVFNACDSEMQAQAIARYIPYVIGMSEKVFDWAAIEFTFGFYTALGAGKSYEQAYNSGCNSIRLAAEGRQQHEIPKLFTKASVEASPVLWIQGWAPIRSESKPTANLDWRSHYHEPNRRIPTPETWEATLFAQLEQVREIIDSSHRGKSIEVISTAPLSAVLVVGWKFLEMGGFQFQMQQRTGGEVQMWQSTVAPSNLRFKILEEKNNLTGEDVLVVLGITGDPRADVDRLLQESDTHQFRAMVYAEPESGVGNTAINNADAVALSIAAKDLLARSRSDYKATKLHLVLYTPAAFCLFLGQRLNALGDIIIYERKPEGGYLPAMQLRTR